jgi:hypothetical protein
MLEAHRRNHTGQDRSFTGFIPENSIVFTRLGDPAAAGASLL